MSDIILELSADGGLAMLHDDAVDLAQFGQVLVSRASNVEFSNEAQAWFVQSALTGKMLREDFKTRKEALDWEHDHYSPGGQGWGELR